MFTRNFHPYWPKAYSCQTHIANSYDINATAGAIVIRMMRENHACDSV